MTAGPLAAGVVALVGLVVSPATG
ncbi:MAG: hypothetical protein K0S92_1661, partial [Desertimonas sp.]|nr:hypothetical protein [Desertimonas sp.]